MRAIGIGFVAAVVCLAGCDGDSSGDAGKASSTTSTVATRGALAARIVLPARTLVAGSTMAGEVLVTNNTGSPVPGVKCGSPFQLVLRNETGTIAQGSAWSDCAQPFTIANGETRWPVAVAATYINCGPGGSGPCVDGPIASGDYQVVLAQNDRHVPPPRPIPVRITST